LFQNLTNSLRDIKVVSASTHTPIPRDIARADAVLVDDFLGACVGLLAATGHPTVAAACAAAVTGVVVCAVALLLAVKS
jgi:hypothetical protein